MLFRPRKLVLLIAVATASLSAGCSMPGSQSAGSSAPSAGSTAYSDGYSYGSSYWPQAKDNGLSYTQECSALSGNAPSGDDVNQWEAGCVSAGQALVTDPNP